MPEYVITYWENEDLGDPPAVRTKSVKARGIVRAVLEWNIQIYWMITGQFKSIELNGHEISRSPTGMVDVSQYVIEDGDNTIKISFDSPQRLPFSPSGKAYVVLRVSATTPIIEEEPIKVPKLEWWHWVLIVVIILLLLAFYFLYTKTKVIQTVGSSISQTVKEVIK